MCILKASGNRCIKRNVMILIHYKYMYSLFFSTDTLLMNVSKTNPSILYQWCLLFINIFRALVDKIERKLLKSSFPFRPCCPWGRGCKAHREVKIHQFGEILYFIDDLGDNQELLFFSLFEISVKEPLALYVTST